MNKLGMKSAETAREFAKQDEGLSNPYHVYQWLVYELRKEFGVDSVTFHAIDFGMTLVVQVAKKDLAGKFSYVGMIVRQLKCLHHFKLPGEDGYGTECLDHPSNHRSYDIAVNVEKEGGKQEFVEKTIQVFKAKLVKEIEVAA